MRPGALSWAKIGDRVHSPWFRRILCGLRRLRVKGMTMTRTRGPRIPRGLQLLLVLSLLWLSGCAAPPAWAQDEADPPGRVGRLALREGPVRWFDHEQQRLVDAPLNLPLTRADRILTEAGGRAELRIGSTLLILDEASELVFDRLDDEALHIRLLQGRVALRLRTDELAREVALGSDEAWLRPLRAGLYGLRRDAQGTEATSWRGQLQLDDASRAIVDAGRRLQLRRRDGELSLRLSAAADDAFAARVRVADAEEARLAEAAAHVSTEMTGYEDLARYGHWDTHPEYGAVWAPAQVAPDWVPYREGRWLQIRPWGWTWVDTAPWGFAPFHYGRWMRWHTRWVWVPGAVVARPVFAPALVAWIEAPGIGIGVRVGGVSVGWMPLAPWQTYRPAYRASPHHLERIDPPAWRRHRPPPGWGEGMHTGRDRPPHGVGVLPSPRPLRPPPPPGMQRHPEPPRPLRPEPVGEAPVRIHPPMMGEPPARPPGQARQRIPERALPAPRREPPPQRTNRHEEMPQGPERRSAVR